MAYQTKKHRKFVATSVTAAVVAAAVAPMASAASFSDVKEGSFYAEYVNQLFDAGVVEGRPDGSFGLGDSITRAEAAKMVSIIRGLDTKNAPAADFSDVKQSAWYAEYVNALYAAKLIDGVGNGKFDPSGTLTRAQFAEMVVKAYGLESKDATLPFTDLKSGAWYGDSVETLYANGLITGMTATKFGPGEKIKRADFAKLLVDTDLEFGFFLGTPAVTAVTATNAKTLTLTGTALQNLKVENITVEGNKVASVSGQGKSATVALETPLVDGQEYKVTVKVGEETKEFTVKFTFVLADVAVTTTTLEANKDKQFLQVSFNGQVVDLATIDALGYDIEFQADENVFLGTTNVSLTGEIDETKSAVALNKSFNVKAVVTKDGKTAESKTVKVEVVSKATPAIGDIVLSTSELTLTKAIVSTKDSTVAVKEVESNTGDVINKSGLSAYASSNPEVATIDASNGAITPIKAGKTTITVKAGSVVYSKEITVVDQARVATKATADTVHIAPGADSTVNVAVVDQYGEKVDVSDIIAANISVSEVTGVTVATADFTKAADGKLPVTLDPSATAAAGSYTVVIKDLTTLKNLGQFTVKVSADNVADNYKLLVADTSKGVANLAGTKTITLNANEYTKSGAFLQTLDSGDTTFTVESANPTVATVTTAPDVNGDIVVTGVKVGTTQIILKKGGVQVATASITVKEEVATIESITWKNNGTTISVVGKDLTYKDIFTITETASGVDEIVEGVKLSTNTTSKVRIDLGTPGAPVLYLDKNDDGNYVSTDDEILGTVAAKLSKSAGENITLGSDFTSNILGATTASKHKGTVIFTVTDDDANSTVRASSTINVDVQ